MYGMEMALAMALHDAHRERVAACIDHDLAGPLGTNHVFATCRKCGGHFKVEVVES